MQEPEGARLAVLVMHGGASRAEAVPVSPTQLSVLRMVPVARRIATSNRDVAVYRLLNSVRGWDARHSPVEDARWALDRIAERAGHRVPSVLVGHSLGGRAALAAGVSEEVRGVVALNPWLYPDDDMDLLGRRVLLVHGTDDRIAPADRSAALARRLLARGVEVERREVPGGKHAMLRHGSVFERAAAAFVGDLP